MRCKGILKHGVSVKDKEYQQALGRKKHVGSMLLKGEEFFSELQDNYNRQRYENDPIHHLKPPFLSSSLP
jgi:hypothetical protein